MKLRSFVPALQPAVSELQRLLYIPLSTSDTSDVGRKSWSSAVRPLRSSHPLPLAGATCALCGVQPSPGGEHKECNSGTDVSQIIQKNSAVDISSYIGCQ